MSEEKVSKTKKEVLEEKVEVLYSYRSYCNLIGANSGVRFVAELKFKSEDKKTEKEWKEIFEKEEIV